MMSVAADVSYQGETSGGVEPENATDDFTLYNARVAVADQNGQWRVMLWGRNLSDEYYYPAAYTGGNGPYVRSTGMPRTYGVTLNYNF
jgi:iron complex outermembrane receptor protein